MPELVRPPGRTREIGVGPEGVRRLAWTEEDAATRAWFERQAEEIGLRVDRDPAGNLWARPDREPPWWGIGSHLDSVRGGGRFDGPLGVGCAFEIAADAAQPIAVVSFADEEGARFNTPTFGSKALSGRLDLPAVLSRRDDAGVELDDAIRAAGVDPGGSARRRAGSSSWPGSSRSTSIRRPSWPAPASRSGWSARWPREPDSRWCCAVAPITPAPRPGRSGATRCRRRRALIVGAEDLAEADPSLTVTTSRILAKPNAPTTIAAEVRLWIDARAPGGFAAIDSWRARLEEMAAELAARSGVEIELRLASRGDAREFSPELRAALARATEEVLGHPAPEVVCFAGHDAGVIAERLPAAMVLVRNRTGVSHSPAEDVELADAAIAAQVVERALELIDGGL